MQPLNPLNLKTFYPCDSGLLGVLLALVVEGNVEAPEFLGWPERTLFSVSKVLPNPNLSSAQVCVSGFLLLVSNSFLVLESNHTVFVVMKRGKST